MAEGHGLAAAGGASKWHRSLEFELHGVAPTKGLAGWLGRDCKGFKITQLQS